ncbi:MAG TPA: hypothetical protein DCE47_06600 [Planctomycetaceae bacterium]|nr:hypothetical protein [Planctomycetaceae bacterium]HCC99533.1 hypothetical protein [Planctomycetaceae bacterium]|tara:strand:- start:2691 stop:3566 length:876 start_codon:yes stop_codon:yes gene_type:complete
MYHFLSTLDRRWIFLLMGVAVTVPILLELQFPEEATSLAHAVFNEIEQLEEGDPVLLAFDYDPASEGELGPMATAFVRHCCEKKLKIYFIALWPVGPQMIDDSINRVIKTDFPDLVYGEDYVNLGFKPGNEGVIKVIVTDLKQLYSTDDRGTNLDQIPMCRNLVNIQSMDLVAEVSAGYPGVKEWVQYAATPYPDQIRLIAGCTGVGAPLLYPYIPEQLKGLLGAIKGAAEYEKLVVDRYDREAGREPDLKYLEGKRRMGPQLVAHILMVVLIVVGNIVFFVGRSREGTNS